MRTVAYQRDTNNRWKKVTPRSSGVCFTISWDRFQEILETGKLPKAFPNWRLGVDETVERWEIADEGVVVFIKEKAD